MTRERILEDLQEIFRALFDDKSIVIGEQTTARDIEDWDSLEHINLINMIERRFQIKFDMKDVVNFKNVGDMVSCLFHKLS